MQKPQKSVFTCWPPLPEIPDFGNLSQETQEELKKKKPSVFDGFNLIGKEKKPFTPVRHIGPRRIK